MSLLRRIVLIVALGSAAIVPFTFSSDTTVLASQLLANGGFEQSNFDAWRVRGDVASLNRTPALKRTGNYSAALTSASASDKSMYQAVGVVGGTNYTFSGYILKNDPNVASAFFRVTWYTTTDATGLELFSRTSEPLSGDSPEFRLVVLAANAPAGARSARVLGILHPGSTASATIYFDDLSFEGQIPVPTPTPSPTPSPLPTATLTPISTATPSPSPIGTSPPLPAVTWSPTPIAAATPGNPSPSPAAATEATPTMTVLPASDLPPTPTPEAGTPVATWENKILISEVLVDPNSSPEATAEWVELYNAGAQTVDIGGWTLSDNSSSVILPASALAPGSYLVIAGDSRKFSELNPGLGMFVVQSPAGRIGNGLANQADMVVLKDPSGQMRDSINWGPVQALWPNYHTALWDPGLIPAPPGQSRARVIGWDDAFSSSAWMISTVPSPGQPNPSVGPAPTPSATPRSPITLSPTLTPTPTSPQTAGPSNGPTPGTATAHVSPRPPQETATAAATPSAAPPPASVVSGGPTAAGAVVTSSPSGASLGAPAPGPTSQTQSPTPIITGAPVGSTADVIPSVAAIKQPRPEPGTYGTPSTERELPAAVQRDITSTGPELLPVLFIVVPTLGLIFLLKSRFIT